MQNKFEELKTELKNELKKEFKEEIGRVDKDLITLKEELKEIKVKTKEKEKFQKTIQEKVASWDAQRQKLERNQEFLEMKELETQLRLRNIQESPNEDIRGITLEILATSLKSTLEIMDKEVDQIYRFATNYSRKNKTPRDVLVSFVRKRTRDEVLQANSKIPLQYKGEKVVVLKEFPQTILTKRRQYFFLTQELKKRNIRFRWERTEGIMTTYKEQKHWLTSIDKAKDFYEKLIKDQDVEKLESKPPRQERKFSAGATSSNNAPLTPRKGKKSKRARFNSPDYDTLVTDNDDEESSNSDEGKDDTGLKSDNLNNVN
ncbi:uncharacterized protein PF3D7_1120000-like [Anolis sagrei]|uniref:uncharacterized protein PF3D7_1120000-like n=1 Tax=Anolis sagrei TaxID=38937 RepID=UPI0035217ED9